MEMKQVERSSIQIPNRCVARVPPTAPWRQGTVTQPSGPARGHGCAPQIKVYYNLPYLIIYLGIPQIFLQTFLITRSQASTRAVSDYKFAHNSPRRGRALYLSSVCRKKKKRKKKRLSIYLVDTNNEDRKEGHSSRLLFFYVVSIISYRIFFRHECYNLRATILLRASIIRFSIITTYVFASPVSFGS